MSEVLTAEQAARYLQVNPETVRRAARSGRLPAARMGRRWRFQKSALDQWLADGGSDYEKIVDQGLLEATEEAMAAVAEGREKLVPWSEAKKRLGV
jgi:excisionase family DNA binding protein